MRFHSEAQARDLLTFPPWEVAPLLLGAVLRGPDDVVVRIVEVEAYSGPGRLGAAVGFSGADSGYDLLGSGSLQIPVAPASGVARGPRVGISRAPDRRWRFWLEGEGAVTRYRPGKVRRRRAP